MKKKALILFMTGMLATTSLTGCGSWNGDDVALTVGKEEISADVANFYARYTQATYETYYSAYLGEDMWNSEAEKGKTYEESVKDSVAGELEAMALCDAHKKDYDVALTDEEKASIKKAAKSFSEDNGLEQKEKVSGQEKTVEKVFTMMLVSSKVRTAIEAGADTEVSDEEAAQKKMQYVLFSNTKTTEEGETQELTEDEKKEAKANAEKLAEAAKNGGDLTALAAEYSLETSEASFDSESETPDADLVKAADQLGENEVTDVIETSAGYYVGKVVSLMDADATASKKEEIVNERKAELYNKTVEKWKEDTEIKVHKNVWKKIDFNDLSVIMKQEVTQPYSDELQTDDQAEVQGQ